VAHREEEPVELQDWTPSSTSFDPPAATPGWGIAETPAPAPVVSSREEAIAEVLRAAINEGRSEESLTGILRRVMDGASPAAALAEAPFEPQVEVPPAVTAAVSATVSEAAALPEIAQAVVSEPVVVAEPVVETAIVEVAAEAEVFPAAEPVDEAPAAAEEWPASALLSPDPEPGWDPISSSLWADFIPTERMSVQSGNADESAVDAPIEPQADEVAAAVEVEAEVDVVAEAVPEVVAAVEPEIEAAPEQTAVEDAPVAESVVEETVVEETVVEEAVQAPVLARTASDPAPLSLDATSVMPPLSLLPPLPSSRRGGRPPVPPSVHRGASARPAARPPAPAPAEEREASPASSRFEALATVTRLPLVPADETPVADAPVLETPLVVEPAAEPVAEKPVEQTAVIPPVVAEPAPRRPEPVVERPRAAAPVRRPSVVVPAPAPRAERPRPTAAPRRPAPAAAGDLVSRLTALGLPEDVLDARFAADAATQGTYAALTRALAARLPETPELPSGAGEVLVVVGPGVETLRAARALAATLHLDTDRVQWATRGDLAGLVPAGSRMATVESAIERRQEAIGSGTLTVVAVDAPLRADAYWTAQMLAIWAPVAVWAVVEATRKPEDLEPWIEGLPRVDALMVQDTDLSADPAAVLHRVALPLDLPVAFVDGMRATPHRWASLLCERLETPEA
jgi:hypothetical protein